MNNTLKWIFIPFLLSVSISASLFMIIESGSFFQKLYHTENSLLNMGYWAAGLNEIFMAVMAAVWLPDIIKKNRKEKIHPGNYLFKFLLIFLFLTTVLGSSFNTVFPIMGRIQVYQNNDKIIGILQAQVQDNNLSLNTFVQQKQRVNSALSVKRQIQTREELKNLLKSQKPVFGLWVEAIVIIVIRFGVQLANLSCIWLTGWIYRQPLKKSNQQLIVSPIKEENGISVGTNQIFFQKQTCEENN
ncbi:hypothetical protein KKA14_20380, partial [bacterium]|nr:hypothetical protein [bacterium]